MILDQKMTTVAYRCPACGATVKSMIGAFTLSGDMMKLKCPCGESKMVIENKKDGKIRLTVPCFLCPNPHIYNLSKNIFFGRDIFALTCSYTGIDIGFVGSAENVENAVREADLILEELLGEASFEDVSYGGKNPGFDDSTITDILRFVISDLAEEGNIHCGCEPHGGEYDVVVSDDGVRITCKNCGRSVDMPIGSSIAANAFLHCDEITLS